MYWGILKYIVFSSTQVVDVVKLRVNYPSRLIQILYFSPSGYRYSPILGNQIYEVGVFWQVTFPNSSRTRIYPIRKQKWPRIGMFLWLSKRFASLAIQCIPFPLIDYVNRYGGSLWSFELKPSRTNVKVTVWWGRPYPSLSSWVVDFQRLWARWIPWINILIQRHFLRRAVNKNPELSSLHPNSCNVVDYSCRPLANKGRESTKTKN